MRNEPSAPGRPEENVNPSPEIAPVEGLFKTGANVVLHHVQDTGNAIVSATKGLANQAAQEIDGKGLACGVVAMSAGEAVGSAIGGVIGAVAGPGGAIVGAQIGAFAGGSLGARYGYDYAADKPEGSPSPEAIEPEAVLAKRGTERLGEAVGEAGGVALSSVLGSPMTRSVLGRIGGRVGGSIAEHATEAPPETLEGPNASQNSYRKPPPKVWFKRIAKEHLAETVLSGALGLAGGLVGGGIGQKLGHSAGIVASSRLRFGEPNGPESLDPPDVKIDESKE
ncbi:MAG: hypothetical protein RLZZ627_1314 [Pseudomonadota bacterium]